MYQVQMMNRDLDFIGEIEHVNKFFKKEMYEYRHSALEKLSMFIHPEYVETIAFHFADGLINDIQFEKLIDMFDLTQIEIFAILGDFDTFKQHRLDEINNSYEATDYDYSANF